MIRILHVLGGLNTGGAENFVMNLYREIDTKELQFDFVRHVTSENFFDNEIIERGGKIYDCPRYNGKNHKDYCKWWKNFFASHPEYKLIHGHSRSTSAIYLKTAKQFGLVTVSHSHSVSNGRGISAKIKDYMQRNTKKYADYMFACSDEAGQWMFGKNILENTRYKTLPNVIDCSRFKFDYNKRRDMRSKLNIEDDYVLGHVGRFTDVKNHDFLLEVFANITNIKNIKLLLVGDGELYESIQEKAKKLGIEDKVIFVGAKGNTQDYYNAMDIFTFPSTYEGLGIAVIEAQASGLPCIVSDKVPRAVEITNLVQFAELNKEYWKEIILKEIDKQKKEKREDYDLQVSKAGYDVHEFAIKMQRFYCEKGK